MITNQRLAYYFDSRVVNIDEYTRSYLYFNVCTVSLCVFTMWKEKSQRCKINVLR